MHKINHANIKDWAKNYDGPLFDGILCDPPYELGFMGKSWDSSGIAFDTEMWADIYKLLKPGAHLLAFSGSRTYHRMAVAIEDAGFEIRDMIEYVYGSGFPKSTNISKQLDKRVSVEAGCVPGQKQTDVTLNGTKDQPSSWDNNEYGGGNAKCDICGKWFISGSPCVCPKEKVEFKTEEARFWEGYGTALKPAHEPCVLARKPLEKGHTVATNALKHGTGGLNIDGTRVGTVPRTTHKDGNKRTTGLNPYHGANELELSEITAGASGRFPANLILSKPEDEYTLKSNLTPEQRETAKRWLYENA